VGGRLRFLQVLWNGQAPALDKCRSTCAARSCRHGDGGAAHWRQDEAAQYVDKMLTLMQGTPYEATAKQWKADPASASASALTCKSVPRAGPALAVSGPTE
jgi:hypothetical protein